MRTTTGAAATFVAVTVALLAAVVKWYPYSSHPVNFESTVTKLAANYISVASPNGAEGNWTALSAGDNYDGSSPLRGVTVVITGATSGIGRSLATNVHKLGATVVAMGRNPEKLSQLVTNLSGEDDSTASGNRIFTFQADNSDLTSVAKAANAISSEFERIDFLINNAGMHYQAGVIDLRSKYSTAQGHDLAFAVNYLSHFLLTEKLLPLLERSLYEPRIIQVSSSFHWQVDGSDLVPPQDSSPPWASRGDVNSYLHRMRSYANSKLAQVMHGRSLGRELRRRSSPVEVVSVCPAWVATNLPGSVIAIFAFPSDGMGLTSIANAMFRPSLGSGNPGNVGDFVSNLRLSAINSWLKMFVGSSVASIAGVRDHVVTYVFAPVLLLLQNYLYDEFAVELSSPESYDVAKQDALYSWSKAEVLKWT